MADPVTTSLAIGGTILGAGTSVAGARAQNKAIDRSIKAEEKAASTQAQQVREAADLRREQRIRESRLAAGRIAASAGERGVGLTGSLAALDRQVAVDTAFNLSILGRNEQNQVRRIQSGLNANITALDARKPSPFLSLVDGGAGGFSSGLTIGKGLEELRDE